MMDENGQVLGASGADKVLQDKEIAIQYIQKIAKEDIQALSQNDIENKYHAYESGIKTADTIKNEAIEQKDAIKKKQKI